MQELFHCAVEPFDDSNAAVPSNRAQPGQDALRFAPNVFEVVAIEFWSLINDQVFRAYLLSRNDSIQGGGHFFGCWAILEHRESHGPS